MHRLICISFFTFLISCGSSRNDKPAAENNPIDPDLISLSPSSNAIEELLGVLDTIHGDMDSTNERPESAKPIPFLKVLHPALTRYLEQPIMIGKYKMMPFKKIPEQVRSEVLAITRPDDQKTGYALLMRPTWTKLFEIQDDGYRIGILETQPGARISGVYSDTNRHIGIDVLGSEGTLPHELRHAEQYDSVRSTRTGRINGISKECYQRLHTMFAEVDATNFELPSWKGTMARVTFDADWYSDREKVLANERDPVNYPFAQEFSTVLRYPSSVSFAVTLIDECPQSVKDFAKKVYGRMEQAQNEMRFASASLIVNRSSTFISWKSYYQSCTFEGKSLSSSRTDESCQSEKNRILESVELKKLKSDEFEEVLDFEIETRTRDLNEIYSNSPYFAEFCREMPGFKFHVNCQQ